jgi:hypothetical protein
MSVYLIGGIFFNDQTRTGSRGPDFSLSWTQHAKAWATDSRVAQASAWFLHDKSWATSET